ncbi:MAG: SDR family NAD(P)-dependent oxidoreductase [Gammaproteobacteria bacterium]|nr:SDR family NAD(P)-dependent oxidoreductase [Gammaproteobacteria bacterium]
MKKSVLITGCSSGIGYYCAMELHHLGYQVFATARKQQDVETLLEKGLDAYQLDLNDEKSIDSALESILTKTNQSLDALFNNGAFGQPGAVEDLTLKAIREQFETNVFGTLHLTNKVIKVMRKQGYGRIIQNSSVLGFVAIPYRGAYTASKFALEALTDTLRLELSDTKIHFSLIEPGPIISKFRENAFVKFQNNIAIETSAHKNKYVRMIQHFSKKEGPAVPFTLGPEAVLNALVHALEAKSPKVRYYVTFPTYLFAYLKRLLPFKFMDKVLAKV